VQSLRSLSIAAGVWNTGTQVLYATQSVRAAATALKPTPPQPKRTQNVVRVSHQEEVQVGQNEAEAKDGTDLSSDHLLYKPNAVGVSVYYVNVVTLWGALAPVYVGEIDPETGYVRSPGPYRIDGEIPGKQVLRHRWTTEQTLQRKTDEWITNDWAAWWDAGDDGIYDKNPDQMVNSDGGLTAWSSNVQKLAGGRLTPAEAESIRTGVEGTKMMAQAAIEFYATAPLEVVGQMRTMVQMNRLLESRSPISTFVRGGVASRLSSTEESLRAAEQIRALSRAHSVTAYGLEGGQRTLRFGDLSTGATRIVHGMRSGERMTAAAIKAEDLRQASMFLNRELGVAIENSGKQIILRGSQREVTFLRSDTVVLHTHPVFETKPVHFARDIRNATHRTEAVIDWSGSVTHFNKSGIIADPSRRVIDEYGFIRQ